jgi:hypothetical protein
LYEALSKTRSLQGIMILMDSLVARKTEDIMLPEVLLEQDEE